MADARHTTVMICINYRANNLVDSCGRRGSADVADALEAGIRERALSYDLVRTHCMGKCHIGPTVRIVPGGPVVMGAATADVPHILDRLAAQEIDELANEYPVPPDE